MIFGLILAVVAIVIDQITKFLIYGNAAVSIIGDFLWFQSTLNTGVAFGMLKNSGIILILISSIACVIFIYLLFSKKFFKSKFEKICLGLILGGTLSNLIDRIIFGGVRDFIYLKFIDFAIFNVADMCITIPVIVLVVYIIVKSFKEQGDKKSNNDNLEKSGDSIKEDSEGKIK